MHSANSLKIKKKLLSGEIDVILFEDESMIRDYQAIMKTWFPVGKQRIIPTYGKHEGVKLVGFLDYGTGSVYVEEHKKYDAEVFLGFLKTVLRKYPSGKIVMILDNAKIHHAKLLQDFLEENSERLKKVAPYGIYTVNDNTGFVNLGTDKDTPEFAAQSVRTWWYDVGQWTFPEARRLYITADGGGSNSSRSRLWKQDLARLAEETGLAIEVSHFPPGTSKWNKVEHRLFCYITASWAGQPLVDVATVVRLIGSTTTTAGLKVICKLDEKFYPTGIKVTDEDFDKIDIKMLSINNGWNYIIKGFKCTNN